jgi:surface antigen
MKRKTIYGFSSLLLLGMFSFDNSFAAENANDTYDFRTRCPEEGVAAKNNYNTNSYYRDGRGFPICQCTSYVADKLSEAWHPGSFGNNSYHIRWSNASNWRSAANASEIGVTDSRANFVWNETDRWVNNVPPYNGAFPGDVAWWGSGDNGHVAHVKSATQDSYGHGVQCVTFSEYNQVGYTYSERTRCKGASDFPDAFIHLTQDYEYCLSHSEAECHTFIAGISSSRQLAISDDSAYGFGGGSESSNPYPVTGGTNSGTRPNIIANNSDVENAAKVKVLTLHINEPGFCKMQTKNIGNASAGGFQSKCWISDGAKIDNNPRDEGKEDTSGLAKGDTHTEHEDFVAPEFPGPYNIVWCTDSAGPAPSQVTESNEGDNCHVEDPFTVWSNPNVLVSSVAIIGGKTILLPGETFSVDATIANNGENFGKTMLIAYYTDGVLIGTDRIKRENLKGGMSKVENLSVATAPTNGGVHTLQVCADYDGRIPETNEGDNCRSINFEVYVAAPVPPPTPPALPDFTASSLDFGSSNTIINGVAFSSNITFTNQGGAASQVIKVGYYLDNALVGTDQVQPATMPLGAIRTETLENFSVSVLGTHTFKSCIDYLSEIAESNEGDNCISKDIQIIPQATNQTPTDEEDEMDAIHTIFSIL